jgi:hypothetical protein
VKNLLQTIAGLSAPVIKSRITRADEVHCLDQNDKPKKDPMPTGKPKILPEVFGSGITILLRENSNPGR